MAVLDKLPTELFGKGVILSEGGFTSVCIEPHELVEVQISTIEDIDAAGGDLATNGHEFYVDDVIPHR